MTSQIIERHIPCEECGSSDAKCLYDDGHGYCFSCSHYFPPEGRLDNTLEFTYEFLPWRGVTRATMEFYGVKTKVAGDGNPVSLGYQYPNGSYKVRALSEKHFHSVGDIVRGGLFGRDKFPQGSHKYVTITEGEHDALSLYQVVKSPVVSVQSAVTAVRDVTVDRSWVNSFERIYIAFDGDAPGREAAAAVARLFDYNKIYIVKFDSTLKDANEFVRNARSDDLRNIWANAKKYLPDTIISSLSEFREVLTEKTRQGVPYPFPTLNEMTYGIRTGESVLITAQEGVGKTELMHAIEYQLLTQTEDNVCAIFLEEPKRRHLQALAGIHLRKPAHLPDSGVSESEVYAALEEVVGVDDRLHLYTHFGSADPEPLIDTIRFVVSARGCRRVLLDHITMAVSGSSEEDERRALDFISTQLEMLVKELDFSLIIVSHVNDFGQTRGSRYISKVADIRIDLDRDVASGSTETHVRVSKNRFCGRTGPAGVLVFNPSTYTLSEKTDAPPDDDFSADQQLALPHAA